jgi:hypothetical protein
VDILAKLVHRVYQDIQASADILVNLDLADTLDQASQDIQALAGLEHLAGQVSADGQDSAVSVAGQAKWVHQAHLAGQDSAVQLVNLVSVAGLALAVSVALVDQAYQGIQVLAGTQASKVRALTLKAQYPHQLHCHQQETIPMMHTLSLQMVICMCGMAQFGTMLVP